MTTLSATQADVFSNARVKLYPNTEVLQVANDFIFRAAGWEPRKRAYDVPPKGQGKDPLRAMSVSRARARAAVRDIALCNRFTHFFTWTLDASLIDRYDADEVKRRVTSTLKNLGYRKGFRYVIVPEFHKDGAIHFHGLCILGSVRIEAASNPYTGQPITTERGQQVYNMADWTLGFSSCIPIDENYERTCNYIVKYLSKDSRKIFGKWYLASRDLIKRPDIALIDGGMDYTDFREAYPDSYEIPLYNDICMVAVQFPGSGGDRL